MCALRLTAILAACAAITTCSAASHRAPAPANAGMDAAAPAHYAPTVPSVPAPAAAVRLEAPAWLGQRSYDYTRALVAFGPRPPGSSAHARAEAFILDHLRRDGAAIESDRFTASTPRGPLPEHNIIAKFGLQTGAAGGRGAANDSIFLVAGHYDTKFLAHFVGADDGGSSAGLLLALADALSHQPLKAQVWLLFLDGEEAVNKEWSDADSVYGSRHLADKFAAAGLVPRMRALLLVDMIGNKGVSVERDTNSTPWLQDFVATAARRLGYSQSFFRTAGAIDDDHQQFLRIGIPSVDLIDLTYRYWHTPQDTMDKLSPQSMQVVGAVVLETLRMLEAQS